MADIAAGDLYNVIYDDSLYPQRLAVPADYPILAPIDIGREVKGSDMADFFIQFMENDALGRIATLHQTLADIHDEGVFHPDCVKLAELHSTAVDFSKTGIPVRCPKNRIDDPLLTLPGRPICYSKRPQGETGLSSARPKGFDGEYNTYRGH